MRLLVFSSTTFGLNHIQELKNKKPKINKTATPAARNIKANIAQREIGHPQESKQGK
jgi:hypothetical protein